MSLSNAKPAMNTLLKYEDGMGSSPLNFITVGELRTFPAISGSTTTQKVTNHSGLDPWEEILPTLLAAGGATFEVNLNTADASHDNATGVISLWTGRTRRTWKVSLPDNTELFRCSAYVIKCPLGPFAVDGVQLMSFELGFTGKPTILGH